MTTFEAMLWRILEILLETLRRVLDSIQWIIEKLIALHPPQVTLNFKVGPVTLKPRNTPMLDITITNEQQVEVTLVPVTLAGLPAPLDGIPTWEVITGDSTVIPAADGKSAILRSADDPGDTQFLVKADADLGAGVVEISDIIQLHVAGAQAANLGLTQGAVTLKT